MKNAVPALCAAALLMCVTVAQAKEPLGLPPLPVPANNPQTPEKIALGKALFEDKRLSSDGTVSCSKCHDADKGFADSLPVGEGINSSKGTRNTPTVLNAAYYTTMFWDGRRPSLEGQAGDPFVNSVEHGLKNHDALLAIVRKDSTYALQFKAVFGVEAHKIGVEHIAKAIASYERTLISGDSPFDRYQYGGDKSALSAEAIRGLELFRGKAKCSLCHTIGPTSALFTNNNFHNLGVGFSKIEPRLYEIVNAFRSAVAGGQSVDEAVLQGSDISQLGRVVVTIKPTGLDDTRDVGRFKTPTLRNVALTAPYMHDGSLPTLEAVIDLYNKGNERNPMLDKLFRPLGLTDQEKADLVVFMKALTSPNLPR